MSQVGNQMPEHVPPVVSRDAFSEGGYTFLRRALGEALADPAGQVIIDSGGLKLTYTHSPDNQTFTDGITYVELDGGINPQSTARAHDTMGILTSVTDTYSVPKGLEELSRLHSAPAREVDTRRSQDSVVARILHWLRQI